MAIDDYTRKCISTTFSVPFYMLDYIKKKGGSRWLRGLIEAEMQTEKEKAIERKNKGKLNGRG